MAATASGNVLVFDRGMEFDEMISWIRTTHPHLCRDLPGQVNNLAVTERGEVALPRLNWRFSSAANLRRSTIYCGATT